MFLYRQKTKHSDMVLVTADRDAAIERAKKFVGEHNDMDGCSNQRVERVLESGYFSTWRSSSFGMRLAWVIPTTDNELVSIR